MYNWINETKAEINQLSVYAFKGGVILAILPIFNKCFVP